MSAEPFNFEFDAAESSYCKPKRKRSPNGVGVDCSHGPDGLTRQQREFLRCYVVAPSLNRAIALAAESGVKIWRSNPGAWVKNNQAFAKAFKKAKRQALRYLEAEARRRAVEGVARKKFYKGDVILNEDGTPYTEIEYSDALLMFLMKSQMPEKYGDKSKLELAGSLNLSNISDTELEERERRLGLIQQRFTLPTAAQQAN